MATEETRVVTWPTGVHLMLEVKHSGRTAGFAFVLMGESAPSGFLGADGEQLAPESKEALALAKTLASAGWRAR
jgi:hypothetical protein